jgi:hypothetical protein
MDIVFVVDDSGSMSEEQANLASNFPMFASVLANYHLQNGDPLDFRVGLTTTGRPINYTIDLGMGYTLPQMETGPNGAFENNCGGPNRWLDTGDATLANDLSCRANVGTSGASIEMPMLMAKRAVTDRISDGTQAGFVRPDALLAVVLITDEDDQSTMQDGFTIGLTGQAPIDWNPSDEVAAFDTLKGDRTRWAAAVIAGDGDCSSSFGMASDGTRLKAFVQLANGQGTTQAVFSSICAGDMTVPLKAALDTFQAACGNIIL